jgi:hypothetical protein
MVCSRQPALEGSRPKRPKLAPRVPPLGSVHLANSADDRAQLEEALKVDGNVIYHELRSMANVTRHTCSSRRPIVSPWIHVDDLDWSVGSYPADPGARRREFMGSRHV